jgi:hypothetical protein
MLHQFSNGMETITNAFLQLRRDQGHCLGLIELQASRKALLSEESCLFKCTLA